MTDFTELSQSGGSFVATSENWGAYQRWLETEAKCRGCGKMYRDRQRGENGKVTDWWICETECMACFEKRRQESRAEKNNQALNLTKREVFAAMAMQGWRSVLGHSNASEYLSMLAVRDADALLKELEK